MRAPSLCLLSIVLATSSCAQNSEAPTLNARAPTGGPMSDEEKEGGKVAQNPTSAADFAPEAPSENKPSEPPPPPEPSPVATPPGAVFAQPVVTEVGNGNEATRRKDGNIGMNGAGVGNGLAGRINGPAATTLSTRTDPLATALAGGWRGAKPEPEAKPDVGTFEGLAGEIVGRPDPSKARYADKLDDLAKPKPARDGKGMDADDGTDKTVAAVDEEAEPLEKNRKEEREVVDDLRLGDSDGAGRDSGLARGAHTVVFAGDDPEIFVPPATTLPRMFYFENTYLGGSAAYAERLRRLDRALQGQARPYEIVQAEVQPFDPPRSEGLGVTASIDATHFEKTRRVFLQVGLRGSSRYGWRRPPLDIVLVVDQPAFARGAAFVTGFVVDLLRQLGPADRLGIVLAGAATPTFLDLSRLNTAQQHLANRIDQLAPPTSQGPRDLAEAMGKAGSMLDAASDDEATVPGTKTLLVLSGEHDQARIAEAAQMAHGLTVQGCVTSVFALDAEESEWWQVANAGFGNLHRITDSQFAPAIDEEMQSLARVVARLVRVNVRLGKEAKAIRVLGTRVLEQREVEEVKARELATDINLSKTMGITSDRGEDDDGIQTVIPYFYGDDSHVILIELWVEGPGTIADVTVRYKDMVNLDNATARTSVRLGARPQPPTQEQILITRNVRGFQLAENLQKASDAVWRNDFGSALENLGAAKGQAAATNALDVQAIDSLKLMVERGDWQNDATRRATLQETLLISGQRRVGDTNQTPAKK